MIPHIELAKNELRMLIHTGVIVLAGNRNLKIYGTLECLTGKKMKKYNRIFFTSEREAREKGFRPCGHCLKSKYLNWKTEQKPG